MRKLVLIFCLLFATVAYGQHYERRKEAISNDRQLGAICYMDIETRQSTHIRVLSKDGEKPRVIQINELIHDDSLDQYRVLYMDFTPNSKYLLFSSRKYNYAYNIETKEILSTPKDFDYQLVRQDDNILVFKGTVNREHKNDGIHLDQKKLKYFETLNEIYRIIK